MALQKVGGKLAKNWYLTENLSGDDKVTTVEKKAHPKEVLLYR